MIHWLVSDIQSKHFFRRFPWNEKRIHGWLASGVVFSLCGTFGTLIYYNTLMFFIGICDYQHSFAEYFSVKIGRLNALVQNRSKKNREINEDLKIIIQFHVMCKE